MTRGCGKNTLGLCPFPMEAEREWRGPAWAEKHWKQVKGAHSEVGVRQAHQEKVQKGLVILGRYNDPT